MKNLLWYFILLNYIYQICSISTKYTQFRNHSMRIILTEDYKKSKVLFKNVKVFYNKLFSMYHDINNKYYSLSENDRTLFESIISLSI